MKLVLATRNEGKVRELGHLLSGQDIEIITLRDLPDSPEVEETGRTFLDNAQLKAHTISHYAGIPALADDSGLEVNALNGAPGVLSARFAPTPTEGNRKLLELMAAVPGNLRTARFVCALVLAGLDGFEWHTEGACEGTITSEPRGTGGFGYDPVFYYPPEGKTFAEIPIEIKNRVSHRAIALNRFREAVRDGLLDRFR